MEIEFSDQVSDLEAEDPRTCRKGWRRFFADFLSCFTLVGVALRRVFTWKRNAPAAIEFGEVNIDTVSIDSSFTIRALEPSSYSAFQDFEGTEFKPNNRPNGRKPNPARGNASHKRDPTKDRVCNLNGKYATISDEVNPAKIDVRERGEPDTNQKNEIPKNEKGFDTDVSKEKVKSDALPGKVVALQYSALIHMHEKEPSTETQHGSDAKTEMLKETKMPTDGNARRPEHLERNPHLKLSTEPGVNKKIVESIVSVQNSENVAKVQNPKQEKINKEIEAKNKDVLKTYNAVNHQSSAKSETKPNAARNQDLNQQQVNAESHSKTKNFEAPSKSEGTPIRPTTSDLPSIENKKQQKTHEVALKDNNPSKSEDKLSTTKNQMSPKQEQERVSNGAQTDSKASTKAPITTKNPPPQENAEDKPSSSSIKEHDKPSDESQTQNKNSKESIPQSQKPEDNPSSSSDQKSKLKEQEEITKDESETKIKEVSTSHPKAEDEPSASSNQQPNPKEKTQGESQTKTNDSKTSSPHPKAQGKPNTSSNREPNSKEKQKKTEAKSDTLEIKFKIDPNIMPRMGDDIRTMQMRMLQQLASLQQFEQQSAEEQGLPPGPMYPFDPKWLLDNQEEFYAFDATMEYPSQEEGYSEDEMELRTSTTESEDAKSDEDSSSDEEDDEDEEDDDDDNDDDEDDDDDDDDDDDNDEEGSSSDTSGPSSDEQNYTSSDDNNSKSEDSRDDSLEAEQGQIDNHDDDEEGSSSGTSGSSSDEQNYTSSDDNNSKSEDSRDDNLEAEQGHIDNPSSTQAKCTCGKRSDTDQSEENSEYAPNVVVGLAQPWDYEEDVDDGEDQPEVSETVKERNTLNDKGVDEKLKEMQNCWKRVGKVSPRDAAAPRRRSNSPGLPVQETLQKEEQVRIQHSYEFDSENPIILRVASGQKVYHLKLKSSTICSLEFDAFVPHEENLKTVGAAASKIPIRTKKLSPRYDPGWKEDTFQFGKGLNHLAYRYMRVLVKIHGKRLAIPIDREKDREMVRYFIRNPRSSSLTDPPGLGQFILDRAIAILEERPQWRFCGEHADTLRYHKWFSQCNISTETQTSSPTTQDAASNVSLESDGEEQDANEALDQESGKEPMGVQPARPKRVPLLAEEMQEPEPFTDHLYAERTEQLLAERAESERKAKAVQQQGGKGNNHVRRTFADKFTFIEQKYLCPNPSRRYSNERKYTIGFVPKNEKWIQVDVDADTFKEPIRKEDLIDASAYPIQSENFDIGAYRMDECVAVQKAKKGHLESLGGKQKVKTRGVPNKHLEKHYFEDDLMNQEDEEVEDAYEEETVFGNPEINETLEQKPIFVEDATPELDMRHIEEKPCKVLQKRKTFADPPTPAKNKNRKKRHRTTTGPNTGGTTATANLAETLFDFSHSRPNRAKQR